MNIEQKKHFNPPSDLSTSQISSYLKLAEEAARIGGDISRWYFHRDFKVEKKHDASPVTIADREAEQAMRKYLFTEHVKLLKQEYSTGGSKNSSQAEEEVRIIGEEFGITGSPNAIYEWVIDPIDGTFSFIHHIPLYTVLIALVVLGEPVIGVIYNPQSDELLSAGSGLGARINNSVASVSKVSRLKDALLICSNPSDLLRHNPQAFCDLFARVSQSRSWGDGHGYMMIATGRADIMIDPKMSYWDIAALAPVIREAGGRFTDISGQNPIGRSAIASNGLLHDKLPYIAST